MACIEKIQYVDRTIPFFSQWRITRYELLRFLARGANPCEGQVHKKSSGQSGALRLPNGEPDGVKVLRPASPTEKDLKHRAKMAMQPLDLVSFNLCIRI